MTKQRAQSLQEAIKKLQDALQLQTNEIYDILATPEIIQKLNKLDDDIAENTVNLKNLNSDLYVKEIYESYLYESKSQLLDKLTKAINAANNDKLLLNTKMAQLKSELGKIKAENIKLENAIKCKEIK